MAHNAKYYEKVALDNGLRVENGKGSHKKIYGPAGRGIMVLPKGELDKGTERNIQKWFKALGILIPVLCIIIILGL